MRTINRSIPGGRQEYIRPVGLPSTFIKNIILFLIFLIGCSRTSFATPAARPKLPDAVKASIRFIPGHSPDAQGRFEIEIYCVVHFTIKSIEIAIGHSKEIVFDKDLPSFQGKMKAGMAKLWRLRGVIAENPRLKGRAIPASITLGIRYLYPYEEGLKRIRNNSVYNILGQKVSGNETDIDQFDEYRNRTMQIIRALPVLKPGKSRKE